jgi:hypothetical protein
MIYSKSDSCQLLTHGSAYGVLKRFRDAHLMGRSAPVSFTFVEQMPRRVVRLGKE